MTTIIPLKLSISNAFLLRGKQNILVDCGIVGDLLVGGLFLGIAQIDRPQYHPWAICQDDVLRSLENVFNFHPAVIYVSHGGPLDGQRARDFFAAHK